MLLTLGLGLLFFFACGDDDSSGDGDSSMNPNCGDLQVELSLDGEDLEVDCIASALKIEGTLALTFSSDEEPQTDGHTIVCINLGNYTGPGTYSHFDDPSGSSVNSSVPFLQNSTIIIYVSGVYMGNHVRDNATTSDFQTGTVTITSETDEEIKGQVNLELVSNATGEAAELTGTFEAMILDP